MFRRFACSLGFGRSVQIPTALATAWGACNGVLLLELDFVGSLSTLNDIDLRTECSCTARLILAYARAIECRLRSGHLVLHTLAAAIGQVHGKSMRWVRSVPVLQPKRLHWPTGQHGQLLKSKLGQYKLSSTLEAFGLSILHSITTAEATAPFRRSCILVQL